MKNSVISLIILATLVSGCASSTVPHAFKPVGFTEYEVELITAAAQEWNTKSNGKYLAIIDPNCSEDVCSTIRKVQGDLSHTVEALGIDIKTIEDPTLSGVCYAYVDHGTGIHTSAMCEDAYNDDNVISFEISISTKVDNLSQIGNNVGNQKWKAMVMHELGHTFGMWHKEDGTVMAPNDSMAYELTSNDLDPNDRAGNSK